MAEEPVAAAGAVDPVITGATKQQVVTTAATALVTPAAVFPGC